MGLGKGHRLIFFYITRRYPRDVLGLLLEGLGRQVPRHSLAPICGNWRRGHPVP